MAILKYLHDKYKDKPGHDPSKYYSLKKVCAKFKDIKNVESLINRLIAKGYIQKSPADGKIRISLKGIKQIISNDCLQ
jgi:hypothetical protein